ncbi:alpha-hydroxy acid oxidase [Microbispora sp. CA-135349]|uniref:alpha-hydroxy acid oxidase n=1 Tax=Microbispora sp. CA-135349 TaxID=3239953 RepID=UPI003D8A5EC1
MPQADPPPRVAGCRARALPQAHPPRTVAEFRARAARALPPEVFDYYDGAAGRERTARDNEAAFDAWRFVRSVLVDVSCPRTETTLLGRAASAPLLLAPTALQRLAHPDGELATARAARGAGLPFVVSTLSSVPLADLARAGGDVWFQLYPHRDRGVTSELVRAAEEAGARVLVLTVDTPCPGRRLRDERNAFRPPPDVRPVELEAACRRAVRQAGPPSGRTLTAFFERNFNPATTWDDVRRLAESTRLPVVLKGIGRAEDARRAADLGIPAVVVSNHGGRQLDRERPTLHALPEIADEVGDDIEVYVDGGVRGGGDILTALALGAGAVLIGRPYLWGLATGGEKGVGDVLRLLLDELRLDMSLTGVADTAAVPRDVVTPAAGPR